MTDDIAAFRYDFDNFSAHVENMRACHAIDDTIWPNIAMTLPGF